MNLTFSKKWLEEVLDSEHCSDNPEQELNNAMIGYDCGADYEEFLMSEWLFNSALSVGKEQLISYLNHYYDAACKYYEYWEFECSGFGNGFQRFWVYSDYILSLCIRYFENIGETKKRDTAFYLLLCKVSYIDYPFKYPEFEESELFEEMILFKIFEHLLPTIKTALFADWQKRNSITMISFIFVIFIVIALTTSKKSKKQMAAFSA